MKKVLIATHGRFAEGIAAAAEIILGKQENVFFLNAYVDETPFHQQIEEFLQQQVSEDDTLFILTDLFGGSVNQKALRYLSGDRVKIITGISLPLVLEIIMLTEADSTPDKIKEIVSSAKEQIIYVNDELLKINKQDDFDL
ncbi:PTS sugar transporter subunit IIA [Brevibacillus sp. B_LB10_24]|uniref:PTS sugar transporter subunit IIA n=1 Tax=Brevibacillus sp. B_LB10_24 TaxID=3380645 RepID=UPI0038B9E1D8